MVASQRAYLAEKALPRRRVTSLPQQTTPDPPILTRTSFIVVLISNQGAIQLHPDRKAPTAHRGRLESWQGKAASILRTLDIPTTVYAATAFDNYRKPRTGMWDEILEDYDLTPETVNMKESFFVGDAAGRIAVPGFDKDFSDSDRQAPFPSPPPCHLLPLHTCIQYFC